MLSQRVLYGVIAVLVVAVAVLGYQLYEARKQTTGIEMTIGERGISIQKK